MIKKRAGILASILLTASILASCSMGGKEIGQTDVSETETQSAEEEIADSSESEAAEAETTEETSETEIASEEPEKEAPLPEVPLQPLSDGSLLETDCQAFCVIDDAGTVYLARNGYESYRPASITKVMTALTVLRHVSPDELVTVSETAVTEGIDILSSGVSPSLKPEEQFTVRDLLYMLLLPSTNAAGNVLAEYVSGSVSAFADLMNQTARELSLSHSHFENPHGLDQDGHYVSAYDMCVILKAACENPELRTILGTSEYTVPATEYSEERKMRMGHQMINGNYPCEGVFAGKTGSTPQAKSTMVTAVQRNGKTYYICTLCSDDYRSYQDTENLIAYAQAISEGRAPGFKVLLHDLRVVNQNDAGMTLTWRAGNGAVSSRMVYYGMEEGPSTAVYVDLPGQVGDVSVTISPGEKKSYVIQYFATSADGVETGAGASVLYTGTPAYQTRVYLNGKDYVVDEKGLMYLNQAEMPDGVYVLDASGAIGYGLVDGRYYAGSDGKLVRGFVEAPSGVTYYLQADGRMATGLIIIEGKLYRFNSYGELQEGPMERN